MGQWGEATYTASTCGSATSCSYDPYDRSTPNRAANSSAWDCVRDPTATIRCEDRRKASAIFVAIPPGAMTPQRSGGASYGSGILDVGRTVIMTGRLQRGHGRTAQRFPLHFASMLRLCRG